MSQKAMNRCPRRHPSPKSVRRLQANKGESMEAATVRTVLHAAYMWRFARAGLSPMPLDVRCNKDRVDRA